VEPSAADSPPVGRTGSAWHQRRVGSAGASAEFLAVTAAFALATLWFLQPLARYWATRVPASGIDPVFNLYVLEWVQHQISLGLPNLWDANFYFPAAGTLALSDHLVALAAQIYPLRSWLPTPVAGYNLLLVLSFALAGATTYWVARRCGASRLAAGLAGTVFTFSPFRWHHLNHLQILTVQWVPLALWAWHRLLERRSARHAVGFLAAYLPTLAGGCYVAYMVHVPLLAIAAVHLRRGIRPFLTRRCLALFGAVALSAAAIGVPLFLPYIQVARALELNRSPDETADHAATLFSYLSPAEGAGWLPVRRSDAGLQKALFGRVENRLYAGAVASVLAAIGGYAGWRGRQRRPNPRQPTWVLVLGLALGATAIALSDYRTLSGGASLGGLQLSWTLLAVLFALGAGLVVWRPNRTPTEATEPAATGGNALWWRSVALWLLASCVLSFPFTYVTLARFVPGLDGMRVPARFYIFSSLAIALFAARGADTLRAWLGAWLAGRRPSRALGGFAMGAVLLLTLAELKPRSQHLHRVAAPSQFARVFHWLREEPSVRAIVELPLRAAGSQVDSMLYSTAHWKPIANGYSGYHVRSFVELVNSIPVLPENDGFAKLREYGITHLVLHTRAHGLHRTTQNGRLAAWRQAREGRDVELVFEEGPDLAYRILPP
jgi:hypothetical protein